MTPPPLRDAVIVGPDTDGVTRVVDQLKVG
jgi:hypothetical protein